MNKYLETGSLDEAEINAAIRQRTIAGEIQPMLCGTAFKNKGVQRMLDAVIDYLPSPVDIPPVQGTDDESEEHTSELQSLMRISSAVFCLKKKKMIQNKDILQVNYMIT